MTDCLWKRGRLPTKQHVAPIKAEQAKLAKAQVAGVGPRHI